ncbi:MAG: mechanosensitive ion channel family protein [Pseudonocardiaceae bacterium]
MCQQVYKLTNTNWLAGHADSLVHGTVSILTIIVVAFVLRLLIHRAINRLTHQVSEGRAPAWLRARERGGQHGPGSRAQSAERRSQRARTIGSLLRSASSFLIYGIAFMMVLAEFGVDIAPILASAGVLGLAIGFGAQNLVRDFLSGIFMMLEDQYGVGDTIDLGEAIGDVEAVGLRTTTVRDIKGTVWYVRNGEINRVGNFSKGFGIAVVDVPLAHHADTEQAGELTEAAAREVTEHEHAKDVIEPPTLLGVQSVTPYGVTLRLTVKTRPGRQWAVQRALNARVQSALTAAGVPSPTVAGVPAQTR